MVAHTLLWFLWLGGVEADVRENGSASSQLMQADA